MVYLNKYKKIIFIVAAIFIVASGMFFYKAGRTISVVGGGNDKLWEETISDFLDFPEPEEDRVDVLMIGIRGFDDNSKNIYEGENGEYLADTIILASFNKKNNQAAIVSIPRDLYVEIPNYGKEKINSAYAVGEARHYGGGGLQLTKALVSMISGVYIDHAVSIDFAGFKKIVDNIGGITIHRDAPFVEDKQWIHDGSEGKDYWRFDTERGWIFYVPSGANLMSSEDALYYARSRYSSSDFDRMKRQQEVISAIKSKAFNLGVLTNPIKIFNILDIVQNNVRTDMSVSQINELISLIQKSKVQDFKRGALDTSESGLLIEDRIDGRFVLMPKSGNYLEVQKLFKDIIQ
ncbi:MAG: LCP family protein [Candidatus Spechtbacterales bacterium]